MKIGSEEHLARKIDSKGNESCLYIRRGGPNDAADLRHSVTILQTVADTEQQPSIMG